MSKLLRALVGVGFGAGIGYGAYHLLLTAEARENIKGTVKRAVALGRQMTDGGTSAQEEAAKLERNREWIASQWEAAGF